MTALGYGAAKQVGDSVVQALRDIATLIGDPSEEPVTLGGHALLPGLGMGGDAGAISARAGDLQHGFFTVIVVGEFKNGKSTLLNAMLGSQTLPAKAAPATAIITMLVNGDGEKVTLFESGQAEPRQVSWEEFVQEFQLSTRDQETIQEGTKAGSEGRLSLDRFSHIEYAQIECNHSLCAQGVRLIDSPGLGEHLSRTTVAMNFLKRSQAAIMVLNATRILTRDEIIFIETVLGNGRPPHGYSHHVFFVVNRIDQVDPAAVEEIQDWVETQLESQFLSSDGTFDHDLYRRRVFFINAKGALTARSGAPSGSPNDKAMLASSGLPPFEQELERFLTGGERVTAALQSTVQFLQPVIREAEGRIEQAHAALDAPLEALQQRRSGAEHRLRELEARKSATERTILLFGEVIAKKVFAGLRSYVEGMRDTWDEDSRQLMDLDRAVSLKNVLAAYAQPEARERMAVAISEEVQSYVQAKFMAWSDRIPTVVEHDTAVLAREVEAQMNDVQLELDAIAAAFAGTSRRTPGKPRGDFEGARLFHLALSLGDIAGITEDVMAVGDLTGILARIIQRSIVAHLVSTVIRSSLLTASILAEVIQAGVSESAVKKRLRQTLGDRLCLALREQVEEKREFIHGAIEERFQQFAANATGVIGMQIDEVRAEQERILQQRREENFSREAEKRRLAAIGAELRRLNAMLKDAASPPHPTTV